MGAEIILGAIALVRQLIANSKLDEADMEKVKAALKAADDDATAAENRWDSLAPGGD